MLPCAQLGTSTGTRDGAEGAVLIGLGLSRLEVVVQFKPRCSQPLMLPATERMESVRSELRPYGPVNAPVLVWSGQKGECLTCTSPRHPHVVAVETHLKPAGS